MTAARPISCERSFGFSLILCVVLSSSALAQGTPPAIDVRSEAPSLEIKYTRLTADVLHFAIHNTTQRAVVSYDIKLVFADPNLPAGSVTAGNRRSTRLIDPGGVTDYFTGESNPRGGLLQAVVLTAVVFDDDTFEGNELAAAGISARGIGEDGQFEHIAPIVSSILADATSDQKEKIARIREEIAKLPEEPDAATVSRFAHIFPTLVDTERPVRNRYYRTLKDGYRRSKEFVLQTLKQFTCGDFPSGTTLEQWWETTRKNEQYGLSPCARS